MLWVVLWMSNNRNLAMCRMAKYWMQLLVRHFRKVIRKVKLRVKHQKTQIRWQQLVVDSLIRRQVQGKSSVQKTYNRFIRITLRDHLRMAGRFRIMVCHRGIATTSPIRCLLSHLQGRLLHHCHREWAHHIINLNRRWYRIHSKSTNKLDSRLTMQAQVVNIRSLSKMVCVSKIHSYWKIKRMSMKRNIKQLDHQLMLSSSQKKLGMVQIDH